MTTRREVVIGAGLAGLAALLPIGSARAQGYPKRSITVVVGYPPGGAIDFTARLFADGLHKKVNQSVIVDNRAGANGLIGLQLVSRAEPDGYTLALAGASNVTAGPHLQPTAFNPLEMEHISRLVKAPLTLAVRNNFPARTVAEFIEYAKKNEVTFGSAGVGSSHHLTGELFRLRTNTKLLHVPYKGSGPMLNDLMSGEIAASFGDPTLVKVAKAGKIRVLGASSDGIWKLNPDLPPISQTVPGFIVENWYGLAAPAKTPKDILQQIYSQTVLAMSDPVISQKLADQGLEPALMETAAFKEFIKRDSEMWGSLVQQANIRL
ncbi:MAG: hypothetical protein JWM42_468 [Burkholderia sp.]|jgi:tripartite-type tricarboxylate transporter receptor subunit TctC|nr:hypothetical protein [Burkholderia sp.]